MPEIVRQPLDTPAAWRGEDLDHQQDWIYSLTASQLHELEEGLERTRQSGRALSEIRADNFPLPSFATCRERILRDMEGGRGFAVLRGVPVERYSPEDAAAIFWALGAQLGIAEPQDRAGHLLHHVRDTGRDLVSEDNVRKYQTNQDIPFHNDGSDILMLLCLRDSKSGGRSRLVSATTVFNQIIERRQDLGEVLQQPFYFDARGQQPGGMPRAQRVPIYNYHEGYLSVLHKRFYVELAQRFPEVPPMTPEQIEALDQMDEICGEKGVCLEFKMRPGDIQIANNYEILHSRTSFVDYEEPERKRHMLRFWLSIPNGRPLPPVFEKTREFQHSYARRQNGSTR